MRFAHLSDWHATTLAGGGLARFRGKRLSGWASWALSRRHRHDPTILEAAIADVQAQQVDRILVTGDLTHISLEQEFEAAAVQLERLGPPDRAFLIPGNHDCYVPVAPARSWDHWGAYLRGDARDAVDPELASILPSESAPGNASGNTSGNTSGKAPTWADYPTLRIAGPLATVGLCSAVPTPVFAAAGHLGPAQLDRVGRLLEVLGRRGLCRVVMIHHPIAHHAESARRALRDAENLRDLLRRVGCELVVHGHKHRQRVALVDGPDEAIPVIGVPSSSEVGSTPAKLAQYHVYTVERGDDGRARLARFEARAWNAETRRFETSRAPLLLEDGEPLRLGAAG